MDDLDNNILDGQDFDKPIPFDNDSDKTIPFDDSDTDNVGAASSPLDLSAINTAKQKPAIAKKPAEKKISADRITGVKTFFTKEGKNLIRQYQRLITIGRGVKNDDAPHNKPSTVKKKGKDAWLQNTGETKKSGFKMRATDNRLLVFASGDRHSGGRATYREIFEWHNAKGYSGVFGQLPVDSKMPERFSREVHRQLNEHIKKTLPKKIKVKF